MSEEEVYEINYSSNIEKNAYVQFLLTELLLLEPFSDEKVEKTKIPPEILFIDNCCNLNLYALATTLF